MSALATQPAENRRGYRPRPARADIRSGSSRRWRVRAYLLAADAISAVASIWLVDTLIGDVSLAPAELGVATAVMLCFLAGAGLYAGNGLGTIERLRRRGMAAAAFSAVLFLGARS